jgi:hypothetical protein
MGRFEGIDRSTLGKARGSWVKCERIIHSNLRSGWLSRERMSFLIIYRVGYDINIMPHLFVLVFRHRKPPVQYGIHDQKEMTSSATSCICFGSELRLSGTELFLAVIESGVPYTFIRIQVSAKHKIHKLRAVIFSNAWIWTKLLGNQPMLEPYWPSHHPPSGCCNTTMHAPSSKRSSSVCTGSYANFAT